MRVVIFGEALNSPNTLPSSLHSEGVLGVVSAFGDSDRPSLEVSFSQLIYFGLTDFNFRGPCVLKSCSLLVIPLKEQILYTLKISLDELVEL